MISLYDASVETYKRVLDNALVVMNVAADHFGDDADDVLNAQLAPDMFGLTFQLHSIGHHSVTASKGLLTGEFTTPPAIPERDFAGWIAALSAWREELDGFTAEAINARAGEAMNFSLGGNIIPFTTENFVLSFSMPNVFFHLATAYDILRMKGAPLSKRHYLSKMSIGAPA